MACRGCRRSREPRPPTTLLSRRNKKSRCSTLGCRVTNSKLPLLRLWNETARSVSWDPRGYVLSTRTFADRNLTFVSYQLARPVFRFRFAVSHVREVCTYTHTHSLTQKPARILPRTDGKEPEHMQHDLSLSRDRATCACLLEGSTRGRTSTKETAGGNSRTVCKSRMRGWRVVSYS